MPAFNKASFKDLNPVLLIFTFFFLIMTYSLKAYLDPTSVMLLLNFFLVISIISLFRHPLKFAFLIQPVFIYLTYQNFAVDFILIGVGEAYEHIAERFFGSGGGEFDANFLNSQIDSDNGTDTFFGLRSLYLGVAPIIFLGMYLFPEVDLPGYFPYLNLSLFTSVCVFIFLLITKFLQSIDNFKALVMALLFLISPSVLELNSSVHRYTILILSLLMFHVSYIHFLNGKGFLKKVFSLSILFTSIFFILVTKPALLASLFLFVCLDYFSKGRMIFFSSIFETLQTRTKVLLFIFLFAAAELLFTALIGDFYSNIRNTGAGLGIQFIMQIPIIGFAFRVLYAILSPFPWINFSQFALYGDNEIFIYIHILSTLLGLWLVYSLVLNLRKIINSEVRLEAMMAVSLLCSLLFSSVGFHAYYVPVVPVLGTLLIERKFLGNFLVIFWSVVILEAIAQLT